MLPEIKKVKMPLLNFPTLWQTVIFRNYAYVSTDKIAKVLKCTEETLKIEAERLGIGNQKYDKNWEERGYITLIRDNWFLLPYSQILTLLGITQEKLEFYLEKEDFLGVKLGNFKPYCEEVYYFPLNESQIEKTKQICSIVKENTLENEVKAFEFFTEKHETSINIVKACNNKIVHGYLTPCGDVFLEDDEKYMPDSLLAKYCKQGINGVWIHGLLSALSPYPFDESLSIDYKKRRYKLIKLINRCKTYGIKVYLYLNEPRGIAYDKLGKYSRLAGRVENGIATLCFEKEEVKKYLYDAIYSLVSEVKDLGGFITITMSENPTHCNYVQGTNCPICKNVPSEVSASSVNNVIMKAIKDSNSKAEVIANLWGWSPFMGWTMEQTERGVQLLDRDISVMCVSEYDLNIEKGGVKGKIIDYSISNPHPSEITVKTLEVAKKLGHKIYAKIQVNNSWECSAVPYLPVFDLTYEHILNLKNIGVENYMLTWTQGGYPSPSLNLIAEFSKNSQEFNLEKWYDEVYGENGKTVSLAVKSFCKGFKEYPFSIQSLYLSPKTIGHANLWEDEYSEKRSTMVCFAFDDYENWITPYTYEIYLSQYKKLLKEWQKGIEILNQVKGDEAVDELLLFAKAAYLHFESDVLQTEFSYAKRNGMDVKDIVFREENSVKELIALKRKSPFIGFETSNHYFYKDRNLIEKLINLKRLKI